MKQGSELSDLLKVINEHSKIILNKNNDTLLDSITSKMFEYGVLSGDVVKYLMHERELEKAPIEEIALLADSISKCGSDFADLKLINWFNKYEIKDFMTYHRMTNKVLDNSNQSIQLEYAQEVESDVYSVVVDYSTLAQWLQNGVLTYNFKNQRTPIKKINNSGEEYYVPRVYSKNVKEIERDLLNNDLRSTLIWLNCPVGSSEDSSGSELLYDNESMILEITKGSKIDILDGMHRLSGITQAYLKNTEIKGRTTVHISNFDEQKAMSLQAQLAKATPFDKSRARQLAREGMATHIIDVLQRDVLKGRISTQTHGRLKDEVVSYVSLENAINANFDPKNKLEAVQLGEKLNDYMMYLFGYYEKRRDDTILFHSNAFFGHMYLAKRMIENEIPFSKLNEFIDQINVSKDNPEWILKSEQGNTKLMSNRFNKNLKIQIDDIFNNREGNS